MVSQTRMGCTLHGAHVHGVELHNSSSCKWACIGREYAPPSLWHALLALPYAPRMHIRTAWTHHCCCQSPSCPPSAPAAR